jgi:DNA/RNA endonuclease YhcR with UshA esterase domain
MILKTPIRFCGPLVLAALFSAGVAFAADALDPEAAASHVGEEVTVCGEVTGAKYSSHRKRKPTFIDFGPPHPNQHFTALIWGEYRDKFHYVPESLLGKTVCVSGTITEYKGKAEIKVSDPAQIRLVKE